MWANQALAPVEGALLIADPVVLRRLMYMAATLLPWHHLARLDAAKSD
jgi:hypothetical protein